MQPPKRATPPAHPTFVPRTSVGKDLWAIRTAAIAAGMDTVGWDEIDRELEQSRAGRAWIDLSEYPALAAVWDNDDDAIFDDM